MLIITENPPKTPQPFMYGFCAIFIGFLISGALGALIYIFEIFLLRENNPHLFERNTQFPLLVVLNAFVLIPLAYNLAFKAFQKELKKKFVTREFLLGMTVFGLILGTLPALAPGLFAGLPSRSQRPRIRYESPIRYGELNR